MYFWKCWRDTRYPFFVVCAGLAGAYVFYLAVIQDWFGWVAQQALGLERVYWERTAEVTVKVVTMLVSLSAFLLGVEGLAQDMQHKTTAFLLSRPQSRAYFLWTNWLVGAMQVSFLILLAYTLERAKPDLTTMPHVPFRWDPVIRFATPIVVTALVVYSLTFLLGIALRSGRNALRGAFAIVLGYSFLLPFTRDWRFPPFNFVQMMEQAALSATLPEKNAFPYLMCFGWLLLALTMAAAAQWSFHHYEPQT